MLDTILTVIGAAIFIITPIAIILLLFTVIDTWRQFRYTDGKFKTVLALLKAINITMIFLFYSFEMLSIIIKSIVDTYTNMN